MIRLLLPAALLLAAGTAAAQDGPPGARRGRPREEVFRIVDGYIASNLQAKLGLSDDQLARVLPPVRRLHGERRRFAERKMRVFQQMRRMSRAGEPNDARAAELLQELKTVEAEEAASIRAGQEAVDAVLTPAQQMRYRVLEAEIEHRLRELMARVRAQRRDGPGRRPGPGDSSDPPARE